VVKLLSVKDNVLEIEDLDILDGTPVVDIKPWVPLSDSNQDLESDLLDEVGSAEKDGSDEAYSRPFTDEDQRKVTVSPAVMDDLESVEELWLELMGFHENIDPFFTPADNAGSNFRKWLTEHFHDEGSQIFLARIEDETVGYIKLEIAKYPPVLKRQRYGYISDAAVKDSFRGMGTGRLLFEAAREWFRSKGITRIELKVLNSNRVAVGFWKRMGFRPIMTTMYRENLDNGNN
jgi:ribosomal protein S18 acetylase RimI-like enzyme